MRKRTVLLCSLLVGGCELTEITTATPEPFVVAEAVLTAGTDSQFVYLHRDLGGTSIEVPNARVQVVDTQRNDTLSFSSVPAGRCLQPLPVQRNLIGTCYGAGRAAGFVRPGGSYRLEVTLRDGGRLTGQTRVPAAMQLVRPGAAVCALPPSTTLELLWRQAADAWVYDVEVRLDDIFPQLVRQGVVADTPNVPLRLDGLSITASDTTLVMPSELGLFDRFDADLHPILVALRGGLPEGVSGEGVIAAADRNYVNWVRGGAFNPSGMVRVPSVRGDGTGMFGSITMARFQFVVARGSALPPCR